MRHKRDTPVTIPGAEWFTQMHRELMEILEYGQVLPADPYHAAVVRADRQEQDEEDRARLRAAVAELLRQLDATPRTGQPPHPGGST
jgi:hypothetical protein